MNPCHFIYSASLVTRGRLLEETFVSTFEASIDKPCIEYMKHEEGKVLTPADFFLSPFFLFVFLFPYSLPPVPSSALTATATYHDANYEQGYSKIQTNGTSPKVNI